MPLIRAERLNGVHPSLRSVVERAADSLAIFVVEGVRSDEKAYANYGKGRTADELAAKGVPIRYARPRERQVTWVSTPLATKHRKQSDGFGHAVDLAPLNAAGNLDWENTAGFDAIYKAMIAAAIELNVQVRSGMDWDSDGILREKRETDSPHYELVS